MTAETRYRLDGLEPDNVLAFLALLGLLRALEHDDRTRLNEEKLYPRAAWDGTPPLRPLLYVARNVARDEVLERAAGGVDALAAAHDFGARRDLNHSRTECRQLLEQTARKSGSGAREHIDLLAALMSDGAIKDETDEVNPTPFCLLFGQGHQHFLERFAGVPRTSAPAVTRKGRKRKTQSGDGAVECLSEALFQPWRRQDQTFAFRWDPEEGVRYALMAGDPTDASYKTGTQHGANRLAAIGLAALTVAPGVRRGKVRPAVIGGSVADGGFSFAWPIWEDPAALAAIRALLAHPDLRKPGALAHLGVQAVMEARRISIGKYMNFTRASVLDGMETSGLRAEQQSSTI